MSSSNVRRGVGSKTIYDYSQMILSVLNILHNSLNKIGLSYVFEFLALLINF